MRSNQNSIRSLIERLESSPGARRSQVKSFTIRNRAVSDLVPILQQLMKAELGEELAGESGGGDITSPSRPGETRAPLPPITADDAAAWRGADPSRPSDGTSDWRADRERAAPPITFTADDATNTLLAMGEPRLLEQLDSLIKQLDVRQPQVMLEVLLVSLTDSQTLDLGLELEKLDLDGDIQWRLSSLFGLSSRTAAGSVTAGGAGGTAVVLRPGDFSVVLRALQTLNKGRSLSMPMVLVTNNEQATLDSTLEQPFASTTSPSNSNSTTSFGGSLPAGTQISIKPQIADADQLTLDYQLSLSSFSGAASSPNLPPPRQQNRVQSIASIPDGHVVVVGGIELQTDGRASSQVPLLGDLPVIGEAFKTRSKNTSKQRFYVFIRANVLRHQGFEDLRFLSQARADETGIDDGWPKVEPSMIP
jgi:general secretion pathway protein D